MPLVQSSPFSLNLIAKVWNGVNAAGPNWAHQDRTYWRMIYDGRQTVATQNSLKKKVRIFVDKPVNFHPRLLPSPSSKNWRNEFPSFFEL
jgi:hypothetical protein